jgi:putative tryptophan/tyrosine transport system substrate-binding protein
MKRREFITLLGGTAAAWPLAARAQKPPPLIGFLGNQPPLGAPQNHPQGNALVQGFRDNGLVIGRDVVFEPHFTGGDDALFPVFARELAQKKVRMILANTPAGVRAAQHLDPPVPVLMVHMTDPVREGLVANLARPGGHTTGTASLNTDLTPKLREFLREIFPKATVLAVIFNPSNPTNPVLMDNLRAKASPLGITVLPFAVTLPGDFDVVFPELVARHHDALQVIADPLLSDLGHRITELALPNGLPTFTNNEWSAETSGLIGYGASSRRALYRMGYYVKKILDGANPGEAGTARNAPTSKASQRTTTGPFRILFAMFVPSVCAMRRLAERVGRRGPICCEWRRHEAQEMPRAWHRSDPGFDQGRTAASGVFAQCPFQLRGIVGADVGDLEG